jgi:hypothetical protein
MKRLDLSLPEFGFVVTTRAALGAHPFSAAC